MKTYTFNKFSKKMQTKLLMLLLISVFSGLFPSQVLAFQCPEDITISCCTDYNNTDITGNPADFNQGYHNFSFVDEKHLSVCREGYIIRTWTGYVGTTPHTCEQIITMEYMPGFEGTIQWPPDWTGNCGDEIPFIEPSYDRGFCDMVAHTYNDDTLRHVGNVCMKILRNWKVIDWCKYQPNTGDHEGVWKYTQVLNVIETTKPEISNCGDWDIPAMNSDCTADTKLYKSATDMTCEVHSLLNWKIEFDRHNDWSTDSIVYLSGDTAWFDLKGLEPGQHKIIWKVSDRCGNVSQCMELINVEDGKPPTPYCYLSMPLVLMPQGNMLEVDARHFIKAGEDNCNGKDEIIYSWTTDPEDTVRIFDCNDAGFQFLPVYAIDASGNSDFCFIFTRVLDHGNCSGSGNLVSGNISDFSGNPVNGIRIALGNNPLNIFTVDTSAQDGSFGFPYIETIAEPEMYFKDTGIGNSGITTLDLVVLKQYLLGLILPHHTADFLAAADINGDGRVNVIDLYLMRQLILGIPADVTPHMGLRIFREDTETPGQFQEIQSLREFKGVNNLQGVRVGDLDAYFR